MDSISLNKLFHDHECAYYDERFAIVHDARSARVALEEVEALLKAPLESGATVLDVGCGTGWYAAGLLRASPDTNVIGLDLSAGMLSKAADAGARNLVQGQAERLPFPDACMVAVVVRGVLHHLPDPATALAEWRRVLIPDGALVLTSEPTPSVERHGELLVRAMLRLPGFRRRMSPESEFWELAAMAANLHTFTRADLTLLGEAAGYSRIDLRTSGFGETLAMTASYVAHGHSPGVAGCLPWRSMIALGARADGLLFDKILSERMLHTVVGVLRP